MTRITTSTADATSDGILLGLSVMGSAIAATLVDRGYRTTVWSRTAHKSAPLVAAGAMAAATAAEAIAASPLVVICLLDRKEVEEVLGSLGTAVAGKLPVNGTSGSPAKARRNERWASQYGAEYIDRKIMGDPPYFGTPLIMFPFSGSPGAFATHESILQVLGTTAYNGEDAGAAAVEFMAEGAVAYVMLIGLLHSLRLAQAEGFDVEAVSEHVAGSVAAYPPLLTSMAKAVKNGKYAPDFGSLNVQTALMDDMISHRESVGVDTVWMREVKGLMERRMAGGHGVQGFSSLFEFLESDSDAALASR